MHNAKFIGETVYTRAIARKVQRAVDDLGFKPALTFSAVAEVVEGERVYQLLRWNPKTTPSNGTHSVSEFLLYMQDYLTEAIHQASRCPGEDRALETVRKVTALGMACMEQNGAPLREIPDDLVAEAASWVG